MATAMRCDSSPSRIEKPLKLGEKSVDFTFNSLEKYWVETWPFLC